MWIRHWARTQRLTCASLIRWRWLQSIHIRNSGGWLKWMMEDVDTCLQTMWWFVILCELLPTGVVQCGTVHREPIVCVDQLWQLSDPVIQTRPDGSSTARFNICAGLDNFLLLFCSAASDFGLSTNVRPCWGAIDMVWFHDPVAPGHAGTAPPTQLLWPTGLLCGWPVSLEFPAGQFAESGYWQEQFQTISEDVSVCNVLMLSAH